MKKAYMEPQMIVEDFSVSEMVAKCDLITTNTFNSRISDVRAECRHDSPANLAHPKAYAAISYLSDGAGDFDNEDGDNNWYTNNAAVTEADAGRNCFMAEFGSTDFCSFDASNIAFMTYAHDPAYAEDDSAYVPACSKGDSGSTLLQNS